MFSRTGGLNCRDFLGKPTGDELTQHSVQSAGDPVAGAAEIAVASRPDLHHRGVGLGTDLFKARRAQGGNGDRAGVVGVVLVDGAGVQQPDPGGQLRLDVDHSLAGGHQLFGEKAAEALRAFDRPGALGPPLGPFEQPLDLGHRRTHPDLAELCLHPVESYRSMGALVGVDADHHCRHACLLRVRTGEDRGGHV